MQQPLNRGRVLAACLLLSATLPPSADAREGAAGEPDGTVLVTATRTPVPEAGPVAATVVTREVIDRQPDKDLPALLNGLSGVTVTRNGGPGQNSSLSLRGANGDHVLVLVDGIPVGSATLGTTAWQHLPLSQVERIEIVRGPRSSLYGSQAMGGVVQIFTRRVAAEPTGEAALGVGNHGTGTARFQVGTGAGKVRLGLGAAWFDTEGEDAWTPPEDPTGVHDGDRDGYTNQAINGRLALDLPLDGELSLFALRSEADNEFDATSTFVQENRTQSVQQVVGAKLSLSPTEMWLTTLTAGQNVDDSVNLTANVPTSRFHTRRDTLSWQNDLQWRPDHLTTIGADYQRDRVTSTAAYDKDSRRNSGVFLQHQAELGNHRLVAGGRHDHNQAFGDQATGNLSWEWRFLPRWRVMAGWGSAFKAPTFNQLYYPNSGNPNLKPERATSGEAGLAGPHPLGVWSLRVFRTSVKDLIVWAPIAPGSWIWKPTNLNQARIDGLELEAEARWGAWQGSAALTLLDARDRQSHRKLPRRPRESLLLTVARQWRDTRFEGEWLLQGERFDDTANANRVGGFGTIGLGITHPLGEGLTLTLRGDNLLNQPFQTVRDYDTPGRTVMATLTWRLGPEGPRR